jgi:hypothetical protein
LGGHEPNPGSRCTDTVERHREVLGYLQQRSFQESKLALSTRLRRRRLSLAVQRRNSLIASQAVLQGLHRSTACISKVVSLVVEPPFAPAVKKQSWRQRRFLVVGWLCSDVFACRKCAIEVVNSKEGRVRVDGTWRAREGAVPFGLIPSASAPHASLINALVSRALGSRSCANHGFCSILPCPKRCAYDARPAAPPEQSNRLSQSPLEAVQLFTKCW